MTQETSGHRAQCIEAIWESGGKLYVTYDAWVFDPVNFSVVDVVVSPTLYRIDPATGQATAVGPTSLAIGGADDASGVDYAFDDLTGQILQLDLSSGRAVPVGKFAPAAAGVIQGAVPVSAQSFKRRIARLRMERGESLDVPGSASESIL